MNDVQWVEAARALAERAIREAGPLPEQRISPHELDSDCARSASTNGRGSGEIVLAKCRTRDAANPKDARFSRQHW